MSVKYSVIIPSNKMDNYLFKAIDSVLSDIGDKEGVEVLLVVNGCDRESMLARLSPIYADNRNIRIISSNATEISTALNEGIEESCGDIIIRFDADDLWVKGRFNEVDLSVSNSGSDFIFGTSLYDIIDNDDGFSCHGRPPLKRKKFLKRPFKSFTAHPAIFFSRSLFEFVRYQPEHAGIEDVLFMHEILSLDFVELTVINKPLLNYRVHEAQYTSMNKNKQKLRLATYFHHNLFFHEKLMMYLISKNVLKKEVTRALILSMKL